MQIFSGPDSQPLDHMTIKKLSQLGSGTQADVYHVTIVESEGKFVDKTRKIYKNEVLAEKTLKQMFGEFVLAKDLVHPNIVKYEYFMREFHESD